MFQEGRLNELEMMAGFSYLEDDCSSNLSYLIISIFDVNPLRTQSSSASGC